MWIETYKGNKFYFYEPNEKDIDMEDIAHSLSNICRYTGHSRKYYSVSRHSVLCSYMSDDNNLQKALFLHDASEAYIGDIARPFKKLFPEINVIEDNILNVIYKKYNISYDEIIHRKVKEIDDRMLYTEREVLFNSKHTWENEKEPYENINFYWDVPCKTLFLTRANELGLI